MFDPEAGPREEPADCHPGYHDDEPPMSRDEFEANGRHLANAVKRTRARRAHAKVQPEKSPPVLPAAELDGTLRSGAADLVPATEPETATH